MENKINLDICKKCKLLWVQEKLQKKLNNKPLILDMTAGLPGSVMSTTCRRDSSGSHRSIP